MSGNVTDDTHSVKIEDLIDETRGKGLVSLKQFQVGDEILREKPLFVFPSPAQTVYLQMNSMEESQKDEFREKLLASYFQSLSSQAQEIFMSFSDAWHKTATPGGVARTNMIPLGDVNDQEGDAMFKFICRANHSCDSNARYVWRHDLKQELLIALRPIAVGEEITVNYGVDLDASSNRRRLLKKGFNFVCNCALCTNETPEIRNKLLKIKEIDSEIPVYASEDPKKAIKKAKEALDLISELDLYTPLNVRRLLSDLCQLTNLTNDKSFSGWFKQFKKHAMLAEAGNSPKGFHPKFSPK